MTAAEYNKSQHSQGLLKTSDFERMIADVDLPKEFAAAVVSDAVCTFLREPQLLDWFGLSVIIELWQGFAGIMDDGYFGPISRKRFDKIYGSQMPSDLAARTLHVARGLLGKGEEFGNNRGEFVHALKGYPKGNNYKLSVGAWCASFVGHCFREAEKQLNIKVFSTTWWDDSRKRYMPVGGAKVLCRRVAAAGQEVKLQNIREGDVVVWDRGAKGSPAGHIALVNNVDDDHFEIIEGNHGEFPALVQTRRISKLSKGRIELIARV